MLSLKSLRRLAQQESAAREPRRILRGLSQSLGYVLTALGLYESYLIFQTASPAHVRDHGAKVRRNQAGRVGNGSRYNEQLECTCSFQKDVVSRERGWQTTDLAHTACPGLGISAGSILLGGKRLLSPPSAKGAERQSQGAWNTLPYSDFPCWTRQHGTFAITDGWGLKEKSTPFPSTQWSPPLDPLPAHLKGPT